MTDSPSIAVIGLGYVGLPLAVALANKFSVAGFDVNAERIAELVNGKDRTGEIQSETLQKSSLRLTVDTADIEGFDILTSGHNHEKFALPHDCFRKDGVGNPARRNQKWVKTGSYLSYKKGNYGARSGMSLKPKGGYLIKFWFSGSDNCHKNISTREIIPR